MPRRGCSRRCSAAPSGDPAPPLSDVAVGQLPAAATRRSTETRTWLRGVRSQPVATEQAPSWGTCGRRVTNCHPGVQADASHLMQETKPLTGIAVIMLSQPDRAVACSRHTRWPATARTSRARRGGRGPGRSPRTSSSTLRMTRSGNVECWNVNTIGAGRQRWRCVVGRMNFELGTSAVRVAKSAHRGAMSRLGRRVTAGTQRQDTLDRDQPTTFETPSRPSR